MGLALVMVTGFGAQFLQADAQGHRGTAAGLIPGNLQHFPNEAGSVFETAAVAIGAPVIFRQQEFIAQVAHAGVDVDDIEAGIQGPPGRGPLPVEDRVYVPAVHGLGPLLSHEAHMGCRPGHTRG